jgi:amino acid transporter
MFSGGPTASVITFPIVFLGVLTQALVIGELSSMIPLSGGQYNWVAILSPPAYSNFLSYLTGWILTIAWQSGTAGVTFMASNMIVALANAMHPDYVVKNWHATLVFFAIVGVAVFVTTWLGRVLPMVESFAFLLYVMGFFTMVIVMAYLSPKLDPSMVFNAYLNLGGWENNVQAVWTSIVPIMFGFNGFDASVHIGESVPYHLQRARQLTRLLQPKKSRTPRA